MTRRFMRMTRRRPSRRRRAGKVVLNKTVLGLVGGAPGGGRHRSSPIHRRRARAASCITAYLLLSRTASANPNNDVQQKYLAACNTLAASLARDNTKSVWSNETDRSLNKLRSAVVSGAAVADRQLIGGKAQKDRLHRPVSESTATCAVRGGCAQRQPCWRPSKHHRNARNGAPS